MFQYETIVNLDDLKCASYTCPDCKTVTTFRIEEPGEEPRKSEAEKCAWCGANIPGLSKFVHTFSKLRKEARSCGFTLRTDPLDQKPKPAAGE
jgi:hypothetical protein